MISKKKLLVVLVISFAIIMVESGFVFLYWQRCYNLEHPYRGESIAFQRCDVEGWSLRDIGSDRYLIIQDKSGWDDAFLNISYSTIQFNPDFVNYTYIVVAWGEKPSSGYRIVVREITINKGVVVVFVEKTYPSGPDFPVMKYPSEVVAFEKDYRRIEFEVKLSL